VIYQFRQYKGKRDRRTPKRCTLGGTSRYGVGADRRYTVFALTYHGEDEPTGVLELVLSQHEAIRLVNRLVHELEEHDSNGCECPRNPAGADGKSQTPEKLT